MKIAPFLLTVVLATAITPAAFADTNAPANPPTKQADAKKTAKVIDATEAEKLIADKKVVVLDVRTAAEFAAGHIGGATNLDFRAKDFRAKVEALPKNQAYLVNCAAGVRSAKACEIMGELQFKTLFDLKGGMKAWEAAGKPVAK